MSSMKAGVAQWRSLEALAGTPAFRRFVAREFPAVTDLCTGPERRQFLRLMAASFAMAGLAGCDEAPDGRAYEVPWVRAPERSVPSVDEHYASVTLLDGFANGVVVRTRNGRPLKVEGNAEHPWSRGGTDVFGQASVLGLYEPSRSQVVRQLDRASSWTAFRQATVGRFAALRANGADGVRLLTGPVTSPLLLAQIEGLQRAYPGMRWHSHAAVGRGALYEGTRQAFGRALETRWRFDQARVVVGLEGDFLDPGVGQVGLARDWSQARKASIAAGGLLELHCAGSIPNLTRAKADYGVPAGPDEVAALAEGLLHPDASDGSPLGVWRARAGAALRAAGRGGLVVSGSAQRAGVQAAVHRLNAQLGSEAVFYTAPAVALPEGLAPLVEDMRAGRVEVLLMLDTNPVYDAPGGLGFAEALGRVGFKVHAGQQVDETALRSDWHLPLTHPLESWGDARSLDGTIGLMQPTVAPLYEGRTAAQVVALWADGQEHDALGLLREQHRAGADEGDFVPRWEGMLRAGFVEGSAFGAEVVEAAGSRLVAKPVALENNQFRQAGFVPWGEWRAAHPEQVDVVVRADPCLWDGAYADNAWLQELPKPLTKLVWGNAVTIAPGLAGRMGVASGDVVALAAGGRRVEGPAWVLPGQAEGVVGLSLGYGRQLAGRIAVGRGYDANALLGEEGEWRFLARLEKTARREELASTQEAATMEGHDFVRVQRVGGAAVGDDTAYTQATLYPPKEDDGRAWGMSIDLDACIGCNACVTACQAENNIAVVGPEQVALGRWMHWLRVDRYYEGAAEAPATHFQPVPCMHCEQAPCEVGCPVEATLHDQEGLNLMVYNRCVGTRACSGYCPYKVRRFNYLDYSAGAAPSVQLGRNPEVTVRARGVMEKCTYCVQRIAAARIDADKGDGVIADGAVVTACQGACPARAITFGDLRDAGSAAAAARGDPRNYALLGELNARPRTTYLAKMAPGERGGAG